LLQSASSSSASTAEIEAHLDLRHDEDGVAGLIDADEGVGRELAVGRILRLHRFVDGGAQRQVESEQETGREAAGEDCAAGDALEILVSRHGGPHD
jgi:hypothetical protein